VQILRGILFFNKGNYGQIDLKNYFLYLPKYLNYIIMHISEFRIKNFKSFEDVTIHFNEKTNIFTGVNNAGKSTMLEAISLWQECYNKLLQSAGKSNSKLKLNKGDYVFGINTGLQISYTDIISVRSPKYDDIFYNLDRKREIILKATLTSQNQNLEIGFVIKSVDGANYYQLKLSEYSTFKYRLLNDKSFIKNPENALKVLFASPLANIPPVEERQHIFKTKYLKESHSAYLAFRNRIEALYQRRNENANPYDTFCNQLSTILLDNNGQIKFDFPNQENLNLNIKIQMGGEIPKDISLVGSGTLQIIEILLNIHEQKSELNIILLDEPDSHIHRQLQARLLSVLNASDNTQIFITTHNESLIRDAQPNWIFHLEKQPVKEYYPIQRDKSDKKGTFLLSSAKAPIIQTLAGKGNGLDFITALESDVLFMVEGVNDALRIQKILSLRNNNMRKFAYWVMGNVDTIFDSLNHYKTVFSEIKNDKTLWEKTVLVFDKDFLTDGQRERLLDAIKLKLELRQVYIWKSYNFDSILFSKIDYLTTILQRYIGNISPNTNTSGIPNQLTNAMNELIARKIEEFKSENIELIENKIRAEIKKRQKKFEQLFNPNNGIIESDYYLQNTIQGYLNSSCNINDFHKIMSKDDCEIVLKSVFAHYDMNFEMEGYDNGITNFNNLFEVISITTKYDDWDFILKV
jgi:predicted ATP-dependent endonuclease of OLD family